MWIGVALRERIVSLKCEDWISPVKFLCKGLPQRSPLSSILFKMYMTFLEKNIQNYKKKLIHIKVFM